MHILLTVLHIFLMELVRRICLNIKTKRLNTAALDKRQGYSLTCVRSTSPKAGNLITDTVNLVQIVINFVAI